MSRSVHVLVWVAAISWCAGGCGARYNGGEEWFETAGGGGTGIGEPAQVNVGCVPTELSDAGDTETDLSSAGAGGSQPCMDLDGE